MECIEIILLIIQAVAFGVMICTLHSIEKYEEIKDNLHDEEKVEYIEKCIEDERIISKICLTINLSMMVIVLLL